MTDHEHEWRILLVMPNSATAQIRIRCRVSACNEVLLRQNAESILNEHAKLKRVRNAAKAFMDTPAESVLSFSDAELDAIHKLRDALEEGNDASSS